MEQYPPWFVRKMFMSGISKGDAEQVREWITWGANPNWRTPKGRPALVKAVRGMIVESGVVKALLDNGADPGATDELGQTALDHTLRRLAKYDGRPRRAPRRSRSLTPGGELILREAEWAFIEEMEGKHPGFREEYLEHRRAAAERTFDTRGNLERIAEMLTTLSEQGHGPELL